MSVREIITGIEGQMQKTLEKMRADFSTLRTGRASAALLENIRVDYYGRSDPHQPAGQRRGSRSADPGNPPLGQGGAAGDRKGHSKIRSGPEPSNDGTIIRLQIPALTEDRRKDLISVVRKMSEEYRVAIRNERRDGVEKLKKSEKAKEISEDDREKAEHEIQKMTDLYVKKVDETARR